MLDRPASTSSSSAPSAVNGVGIAIHRPLTVSRANALLSILRTMNDADIVQRLYEAFDRRDGDAMAASTRPTGASAIRSSAT